MTTTDPLNPTPTTAATTVTTSPAGTAVTTTSVAAPSTLPSWAVTLGAIASAVLTATGTVQASPGVTDVIVGAAALFTALHVHVAMPKGTGKVLAALRAAVVAS